MPSQTTTAGHTGAHLAAVLTTVLAALLLSLVTALPAAATPPFALPDQITDQVGAVEGHTTGIQAALDDLQAEHGIRMWVVFVDTFDGADPQAWADRTFAATDLGTEDYLLAVAIGDRQYGYGVDQAFVLDDAALARVATAAERHLAENPARAVTTAASTMSQEAGGSPVNATGSERTVPGWVPVAVLAGFAGFLVLLGVGRVRHGLPFAPESVREMLHEMGRGGRMSGGTWSSSSGGGSGGSGGGTRGGSGNF